MLSDINDIIKQRTQSGLSFAEGGKLRGLYLADARLLALRELMKLEMPDRWSDVVNSSLQWPVPAQPGPVTYVLAAPPALTQRYFQQLQSLTTDDVNVVESNQGAECLYMIVMNATGDGEARTLFTDQDIGDTDGDGAPEFLDGWGRPIQFIRWPAGFVGESDFMTGDGASDHDPFDLYRRDSPTVTQPPANDYPSSMQFYMNEIRTRNNVATATCRPRHTG